MQTETTIGIYYEKKADAMLKHLRKCGWNAFKVSTFKEVWSHRDKFRITVRSYSVSRNSSAYRCGTEFSKEYGY